MHVLILHNAVTDDASAADRDVLCQADAIATALDSLGHQVTRRACTLDLETLRQDLQRMRPDVVFQLVESLGGSDFMPFAVTGLLDTLRIPYTGATTEGLFLTNHKLLAKQRLCQHSLPTPGWGTLGPDGRLAWRDRCGRPADLAGPCILKAATEHASFGLDEHCVVSDPAAASDRLRQFTDGLQRVCFAEEYVDGREFNISILGGRRGPQILPPAEIDFSGFPADKYRVVGYRAKWAEETFEYNNTPRRFDFPAADRPLLDRVCGIAEVCWKAFELRGYVRVDFRVDPAGEPLVLEINVNPCIAPDAGYSAALRKAGLSYPEAVERILVQAEVGG